MNFKLGEFFAEIGLKGDKLANLSVRDLIEGFGDLKAATVAEIGVLRQFKEIATDAFEAASAMKTFEAETGLSAQQLQKWTIAGQQVGISAETVTSSIMGIQRGLAAIRLGGGDTGAYTQWGIDPRRSGFNPFAVLEQVSARLRSGMDRSLASSLAARMGVSPEMFRLLEMTNRERERRSSLVRGIGPAEEEAFAAGAQALKEFGLVLKQVGYELVSIFGPTFTAMIHGAAFGIKEVTDWALRLVGALERMPTILAGVKILLIAIALYFAPITAAIGALLLLLDDLAGFFEGRDSVIGDIVEGFKKVKSLAPIFEALGSAAKMATQGALGAATAGLLTGGLTSLNPASSKAATVTATQNVYITSDEARAHADENARAHREQINQATLPLLAEQP